MTRRWYEWMAAAWLAVGVAGCDAPEDAAVSEELPADRVVEPAAPQRTLEVEASAELTAHGKELVSTYQCNRCHGIPSIAPPEAEYDCVGCHLQILGGTYDATPEELAKWQGELRSLDDVPTLAHTDRFQRAWLVEFLPDAHDVRPALLASMPRFDMPKEDAEALAAFLVPSAEPEAPALGDAARGRGLLESKGCGSCHRMSGVPFLPARPTPTPLEPAVFAKGQKLAPDLRHARARMRPASLVAWIVDPQAVKPGAAMPSMGITQEEAADIAAYLIETPLEPVPVLDVPTLPPVLERAVTYEEVYDRIFGRICRHCHGDPNEFIGEGGPGFGGGFGFHKRGLDLSTYSGLRSGSLDDNGKRRSVFKPIGDKPKIVAHLMARHAEVAGQPVEGVRGMPLGLPPLPLEDIGLLNTWIAQGRRGPAE
ncbi:MAG: cytochrome c [Myxococcota bacterium]